MIRVIQRGPVAYALLASLALHACGLAWVLTRPDRVATLLPDKALSVVLERFVPKPESAPEPVPEPLEQEPEQQPLEPTPRVRPPTEIAAVPESPQDVAAAQPTPSTSPLPSPSPSSEREPRPRLNLSRPADWDVLATESPEALAGSAFKKSTRQAIAARQQERASERALSRAQVARLGLKEEEYRRRTDAGEEVKTAKGCFVKRVENGPNGHSERWWRAPCRDSKVPEWKREILTFGPDHRVTTESPDLAVEP